MPMLHRAALERAEVSEEGLSRRDGLGAVLIGSESKGECGGVLARHVLLQQRQALTCRSAEPLPQRRQPALQLRFERRGARRGGRGGGGGRGLVRIRISDRAKGKNAAASAAPLRGGGITRASDSTSTLTGTGALAGTAGARARGGGVLIAGGDGEEGIDGLLRVVREDVQWGRLCCAGGGRRERIQARSTSDV